MSDSPYDWDETDQIEEVQKKQKEAQAARANAYAHVFGQDPLGQKILAEWVNEYCTGGVPGHNATDRQCAMRDGKQELIALIIAQIQIARGDNE